MKLRNIAGFSIDKVHYCYRFERFTVGVLYLQGIMYRPKHWRVLMGEFLSSFIRTRYAISLYWIITYSRVWINRYVMLTNPACDQLNRENELFPCSRSRLRI